MEDNMVGNITMLVQKYSGLFLEGMGYTLLLALITVTFGTVLGTLVALAKMGKFKVLSFLATAYIEIMRGTPLLLQLYLFYFLVPQMLPWCMHGPRIECYGLCVRNHQSRNPGGGPGPDGGSQEPWIKYIPGYEKSNSSPGA